MQTLPISEEVWRRALHFAREHLLWWHEPERQNIDPRIVERARYKAQHKIDRIYARGLPEWQERDRDSHVP
jgi:hypothetical protein